MEDQEIENKLREIEDRLAMHDMYKQGKLEQIQLSNRAHQESVRAKVQGLREGASTAGEFFQRQEEYLKKV